MANYWEISSPRPGKDGKTFWTRVGTMFESKDGTGFNLVFDALPLPDKEGRVSLIARPPRPKEGQQTQGNRLSDDLNDSVPFTFEWR
jgi:hypothetical protein